MDMKGTKLSMFAGEVKVRESAGCGKDFAKRKRKKARALRWTISYTIFFVEGGAVGWFWASCYFYLMFVHQGARHRWRIGGTLTGSSGVEWQNPQVVLRAFGRRLSTAQSLSPCFV